MSFVAKLLERRELPTDRLYYLQSRINGQETYYFALIDPAKEKDFLNTLQEPDAIVDLGAFALNIAAKGFGKPPVALKRQMQECYGIIFEEEP